MTAWIIGIDAGQHDRADLEHLLARAVEVCGPAELVCTNMIDGHWAGSLELSGPARGAQLLSEQLGAAVTVRSAGGSSTAGPEQWAAGSATAAKELSTRSAGRAVVFPGQEKLLGEVDTDAVPTLCAIAAVVGVAGTPTAGTRLVTREFVRPVLQDGKLVLQVRPFGAEGAVAPFEVPNPTPCCAAHG